MKKLGKKISFLTKIMLVIGLLISNLSSLSVVFAYEVPENVVIALEEDNLKIELEKTCALWYNKRDIASRKNMYDLINSDENKVTNVFSTLFERW